MRRDAERGEHPHDTPSAVWQDSSEPVAVPARFAAGTREIEKLPREDGRGIRDDQLAQIVHDLKSPLSTISLEASLLEDRVAGGEHGETGAIVARIQHNVRYLDRLIHDILDACLIEDGRLELRRAPTEIRALLEDVIDRVVPTRALPRVFMEASERATIDIDDLRIERVVANLLANALKYAPANSGIVVRLNVHAHGVTVSVIDTGTSLTERDVAGLFEKYQRGTTAMRHGGYGLGLYVSREIVEAHGGHIGVRRLPGLGTRFYFDLPW